MRSVLLGLALAVSLAAQTTVVYREPGRFGGWPANHGIWSWGNEILVGFSAAYFEKQQGDRHQYDNKRPEEPRLARSLDGGLTWSIASPPSLLPPEQGGPAVTALKQPVDFTDPNFIMTLRFVDANKGPSRLSYSNDRGKTWHGPFSLPLFDQPAVAARTDYIVNGKHDAFIFLTAAKQNGREGRVFCARTTDGGLTWKFVSFIGDEPAGFSIMPSTVRLSPTTLLTATRVKQDFNVNWIDLYRSTDNAATWSMLVPKMADTGSGSGNPPSLLKLKDGRLCLTYGFRSPPFGIHAKISKDQGRTWSAATTVRAGGAAWDLGYVRSVELPSGKIVTVYYFNDAPHTERYIESTVWKP